MFSKKMMVIAGVFGFIVVNILMLFISARYVTSSSASRHMGMGIVSPLQKYVTVSIHSLRSIWTHYFCLVSTEKENDGLKKMMAKSIYDANRCKETELANERFRKLLDFKNATRLNSVTAEVIGKDPSQWYKTIVIDKGITEGITKGLSVVVPEGVVGQVIDASDHYAKVLLIVDSNSAVDALVQQTRAHGIIKGDAEGRCLLNYVSRKEIVNIGDAVVSSGLDGVFAKGLLIGKVTDIVRSKSGIFQDIEVSPFVDFDKIEEVLVVLSPPSQSRYTDK
jgi:rod shape-determining protein MreC